MCICYSELNETAIMQAVTGEKGGGEGGGFLNNWEAYHYNNVVVSVCSSITFTHFTSFN